MASDGWLTSTQAADILGITPQRVNVLCKKWALKGKAEKRTIETTNHKVWHIDPATIAEHVKLLKTHPAYRNSGQSKKENSSKTD